MVSRPVGELTHEVSPTPAREAVRAAWAGGGSPSLRYSVSGSRSQQSAGAPGMVFIHEMGGTLHSWDRMLTRLTPDRQVLRYDQRGHGLSEKTRETYTLPDQVDDLATVLGAAASEDPAWQDPVWLVGAAAGAAIAVEYATRHPTRVAGMVMCAPALGTDPSRRAYLGERSARAARSGMRAIVDDTLGRSYPATVVRDAADRVAADEYRARFLANDPIAYGLANEALCTAMLDEALPALRCPCLVLAGEHDPLRPPALVQSQAERLVDMEFAILDCAHLIAVQAPWALASAINDFVARRDVAA